MGMDSRESSSTKTAETKCLAIPYPTGYFTAMYSVRITEEFQDWLDGLKDQRAQIRIAARLRMASMLEP